MILMFSLFNSVRRFVHIQSDHALDLGNICRMNFEAVLFLHILLNTLIVRTPLCKISSTGEIEQRFRLN